jgi:hypothetical protein
MVAATELQFLSSKSLPNFGHLQSARQWLMLAMLVRAQAVGNAQSVQPLLILVIAAGIIRMVICSINLHLLSCDLRR